MIDYAISAVASELNFFLRERFRLRDDRVVIADPVQQDGSVSVKEPNRIVMTLISVADNSNEHNRPIATSQAPFQLTLDILFLAAFNAALGVEAVKFISAIFLFFRGKPIFEASNTPELPPSARIELNLRNLGLLEQAALWASIGAKRVPSLLYTARLSFADDYASEPPMLEGS